MAQGKEYTPEQKDSIIESLSSYLETGFSRNKACDLIGLDPTTLSKWQKNDEALSMKLQSWENAINKLAMANIVDAIKKEGELEETRKETTKWWLERKMKSDFSQKIENDFTSGGEIIKTINYIVPNGDNTETNP